MKFDFSTTLGEFAEQNQIGTVRYHLVTRCGHCDHGRHIEISKLIEFFGSEASFQMTEGQLVCPDCLKPAKQFLSIIAFE